MDCVCVYVLVTFIHYFCCCFFFAAKAKQSKRQREQQQQQKTERIILLLTTIAIYNKKMHTHTHKIFVSHAYHTDTRLYNRTNIFFSFALQQCSSFMEMVRCPINAADSQCLLA